MQTDNTTAPTHAPAQPIPSPCINVCRMSNGPHWLDPSKAPTQEALCEGCMRTLPEIAAWASLGEAAKQRLWLTLDERRANWDFEHEFRACPP